ncbi:NADH-quinone oxidoreductase subunit J [Ancylobacter sp. 6x-1]|uniref:NADH-quinone oxidoreductase subunit J n=1 Tax=Ancylobacter crimeensis TaxID=2579147 RepID=A0ABT0D726_9HYPH|nr:proton-conducting transporter membrane subunit [Ancylobacter crimeensis]MCK0195758.1 NADH-quinone oxidoreductase subunit J [Ancylobacter crimeensis]
MSHVLPPAEGINLPGLLLVFAVLLPILGLIAMLGLRALHPERVARVVAPLGLLLACAILAEVWEGRSAIDYTLGGWAPPLGLKLRADGVSAVMLVLAALVIGAAALFSQHQFRTPPDAPGDTRAPFAFWSMLMAMWSALNLVFVGEDLFNFFVALELLTFSAVTLVCLDGRATTLHAALRYLLFALLGSVLYLLGVGLIYGRYGVLDLALLSELAQPGPITLAAVAMMTVGLMAKASLFPLHLWLPPAHAGAPPAASAVLSALVVKAPFFLILRLWFELLPAPYSPLAGQLLAALGAAAILMCSVVALGQSRLKLMIAYSTVAQIGYLFLVFTLTAGPAPFAGLGWTGGVLQLLSHALAKASMFLAAGLIAEDMGHDRIADFSGLARRQPLAIFAFGLAGLSLMGLPPSGGFVAKLMLLSAAAASGQWWIAAVILAGGVLAAGYVFRVIGAAMKDRDGEAAQPAATLPATGRHALVLALALLALALGFVPLQPLALFAIGRGELAQGQP